MTDRFAALRTSLWLTTALALPALVSAQTAAPPAAVDPKLTAADVVDNDEMIVTAQKRSENLQSVPISIQAIGTKKLDELQIDNFNDYAKFLPSVSFQSGGPGNAQVYFRGVASGGDGNHSGPLPSVGIYLDEQPITTIQGALDIHVYDFARVEALAGPQGMLYGASSQAAPSASSPTSPTRRSSARVTTSRPTTSTAGASAARSRAMSTCRCRTRRRCASSAGTTATAAISTMSSARGPTRPRA